MVNRTAAIFLALVVLGACAPVPPTPYASAAGNRAGFGYSSNELGAEVFEVRFQGNRFTSRRQVEAGMLLRAAEIARQRGFPRFALLERTVRIEDRTEPRYVPGVPPYAYGYPYHHRAYGYGYPYHGAFRYDREIRYTATGIVQPYRTTPPARAAALHETDEALATYRAVFEGMGERKRGDAE